MTTATTDSVAAAEADLLGAQEALRALDRRMVEGDPAVSARDFLEASSAVGFAERRIEAARARERERAEDARQARIAEIRRGLAERMDAAALERARAAMADAIEAFVVACAEQDAARGEAWGELSAIGALPPGVRLNDGGQGAIRDYATTYRDSGVQAAIARVAHETVRKHYPRANVDFGRH